MTEGLSPADVPSFDVTKPLLMLGELSAMWRVYSDYTGGRDLLNDYLLLGEIESQAADGAVESPGEAMVALWRTGKGPSIFGEDRWAETTWDSFSDEVCDVLDELGLRSEPGEYSDDYDPVKVQDAPLGPRGRAALGVREPPEAAPEGEVPARMLEPRDVLLLPFGKTATVITKKVGRKYVTVTTEYGTSRFELEQPVLRRAGAWPGGPEVTPDTAEGARGVLRSAMDEKAFTKLLRTELAGEGRFYPDPSVPRVWGFMAGERVVAVVYLDRRDFECDDEWFAA